MPEPDCYLSIVELVRSGAIEEARVDELVGALLTHKFELGLFESPYVDAGIAETVVGSPEHASLALDAARQAITLLKNDKDTLPLDLKKHQTIAVIGPNADRTLLGGYSGQPRQFVTVLQGLRAAIGNSAQLLYAEGCKITVGGSWEEDEVVPSDPESDRRLIAEAVNVAKQADVVVLAIGGNEQTSREAWMSSHMGDRANLQMVGLQDD